MKSKFTISFILQNYVKSFAILVKRFLLLKVTDFNDFIV